MFIICPDHSEAIKEKLQKTEKWWKSKGKTFSYSVSVSSVFSTSADVQKDDEATKRMIEAAPRGLPIVAPPPGEPCFLFSYVKGKTRPLLNFYDPGCSHAMFKEGVPGGELEGVRIRRGPIRISTAGDSQVAVNDEWVVAMERFDGRRQAVVGVTADNLTTNFPLISTAEAQKEIVAYAKKNLNRNMGEKISKLKVPPQVGGSPDILLGIKYQNCHPEVVFQMPSGLFIGKLRLASHDNKTTAVIGGPHSSFRALLQGFNGDHASVYSVFLSSLQRWRKYGPPHISSLSMTQEDIKLAESSDKAELQVIAGPEGPEEAEHSGQDDDEIADPEQLEAKQHLTDGGGLNLLSYVSERYFPIILGIVYWFLSYMMDLVDQLIKQTAKRENKEVCKAQSVRVMRDSSGNSELNNNIASGVSNCCSGHYSMMSRDVRPRVYTVSAAMTDEHEPEKIRFSFHAIFVKCHDQILSPLRRL